MAFFDAIGNVSFGALPIGWLDADISNVRINQEKSDPSLTPQILFSPDKSSTGYREIHSDSLDLKLGIYGGWYHYMGSYASTWFGAGFSIIPVAGSTITSNRFVANAEEAEEQPMHLLPASYVALRDWRPNDSMFYYTKGGIIFSVGVGYAFTGLSGDFYAAGEWLTYIEKLENNRVFVKLTNVNLISLDAMLGNFVAYARVSDFKKVDDMFAYNFDLSDPRAQVAYEAMIHGSIMEAQHLNSQDPKVAIQVLREIGGITTGFEEKYYLGIPFLNTSSNTGNLVNVSKIFLNQDNTVNDVEYGLFWNVSRSQVLTHHQITAQNFNSVSYVTKRLEAPRPLGFARINFLPGTYAADYGVFSLSFEDDQSEPDTIHDMMYELKEQTGMRQQLKYTLPRSVYENLYGYVHISLNVVLSEAFTQYLFDNANNFNPISFNTDAIIENYFKQLKNPDGLCDNDRYDQDCIDEIKADTKGEVKKMLRLLVVMKEAKARGDQKAVVNAYAKFGEAMFTNQFTFSFVGELAKAASYPLMITFKAEGEKISKIEKTLQF